MEEGIMLGAEVVLVGGLEGAVLGMEEGIMLGAEVV
jgi:hypothetical protein